jgi:hypothetical protein
MADPATIVGSAFSVIQIIDVLARTVTTLRTLRSQWKEADLSLLSFSVQLNALNAALLKIKEWMESDPEEAHHLLIIDLEDSLRCCYLLIDKLNTELDGLTESSAGTLEPKAKTRFVLKSGSMDQIAKMIERQTSALQLLLTACNTKTLSDQRKILTKATVRKTFSLVQQDTVSLMSQDDAASMISVSTNSSTTPLMGSALQKEFFSGKLSIPLVRKALKTSLGFGIRNSNQQRMDALEKKPDQTICLPVKPLKILALGE